MKLRYGRNAVTLALGVAAAIAAAGCGMETHPITLSYPHNVDFPEKGVTLRSEPDGTLVYTRTNPPIETIESDDIEAVVKIVVEKDGADPTTETAKGRLTTTVSKVAHSPSIRTEIKPDGTVVSTWTAGWTESRRVRGFTRLVKKDASDEGTFVKVGPEIELDRPETGEVLEDGTVVTRKTQPDGSVVTETYHPVKLVTRRDATGKAVSTVHAGGYEKSVSAPQLGTFTQSDGTEVTRARVEGGIEITWDFPETKLGAGHLGKDGNTLVTQTITPNKRTVTVPVERPSEEQAGKPQKVERDIGEQWGTAPASLITYDDGSSVERMEADELTLKEPWDEHIAIAMLPAQLSGALQLNFGGPQAPFVLGYAEKFPTSMLQKGREQFRVNCVHCHGLYGDGKGPTADFINPRPRDFRRGVFKFKSTPVGTKPTRQDLMEVIRRGAHGTMMPSFDQPWDLDLEAIAAYVQLLAMRGEVEGLLLAAWAEEGELDPDMIAENASFVTEAWAGAGEGKVEVSEPEDFDLTDWDAAAKAWEEVFYNAKGANCKACHGPIGAGDGADADKYKDVWGYPLRPANLQKGELRGGSRPVDIYLRIAGGIEGTPMPLYKGTITEEQIWGLVSFVKNLRYPEFQKFMEKRLAELEGE